MPVAEAALEGAAIWDMLGAQVRHLEAQLPKAGHATGVNKYLALMTRMGWSVEEAFPREHEEMIHCLKCFLVDQVLSYPYWDTATKEVAVTSHPRSKHEKNTSTKDFRACVSALARSCTRQSS